MDFRAQKNTAAQLKMPAVLRSLRRPEAKPFSEYLLNQMSSSIVLGADGHPMGHIVEVEKNRIDATGARLIRGLYRVEKGNNLGSTKGVSDRIARGRHCNRSSYSAIRQNVRRFSGSPNARGRRRI